MRPPSQLLDSFVVLLSNKRTITLYHTPTKKSILHMLMCSKILILPAMAYNYLDERY